MVKFIQNATQLWMTTLAAFPLVAQEADICGGRQLWEVDGLNDWYTGISSTIGSDRLIGLHFNDEFYRLTPNGLVPGVIENLEVDPETKIVTMRVNQNCKWSDGRPITSADIKTGMETIFHPKSSSVIPVDGLFPNAVAVKSGEIPLTALNIETPDEYTVKFTTDLGLENLKAKFSDAYMVPIPSWEVEANPDYAFSMDPPKVFSGAYAVTDVSSNGTVYHLERNPHYCGEAPDFSYLDIELQSTVEKFVNSGPDKGDIMAFFSGNADEISKYISKMDWITELFTPVVVSKRDLGFYRLNALSGPFREHEIREAFALSLDWEGASGLNERVIDFNELHGPSPALMPLDGRQDYPHYLKDARSRETRVDEARGILSKYGYNEENPMEIEAALAAYQAYYFYPMKEMIEDALPVEVTVTVFDNIGEYYQMVFIEESSNFDVALAEWGSPSPSSLFYLDFFFHSNVVPSEITEEGSAVLDVIAQSSDPEEVADAERKALSLLYDSDIYVPVFLNGNLQLISKELQRRNVTALAFGMDLERKDSSTCPF